MACIENLFPAPVKLKNKKQKITLFSFLVTFCFLNKKKKVTRWL